MPAIELNAITKTFGTHVAVDDLSLTVPEGSVYGFIGPNGSGKTTTLRVRIGDGVQALQNIEGIEKINDFGQLQELRLAPAGDPQKILQEILRRTTVRSFDITRPSLHDIFIRIAGPEAREVTHA